MNVFYLPPEEARKLLTPEQRDLERLVRALRGQPDLPPDDDAPEKPADHDERKQGHRNLLTRILARFHQWKTDRLAWRDIR